MSISAQHPQYEYSLPDWVKTRDVLAGERRLHEKGETYLPKLNDRQKAASYAIYLRRARLYNATKRTLLGWVGAVFRRLPSVGVPSGFEMQLADISLQATPFKDFAKQSLTELLTTGRIGILTEHQADPNGRAYLLLFKAEEIVNWASSTVDGYRKLTLVVLCYSVSELGDDGYTYQSCTEYRELRLIDGVYVQRIYRMEGEGEKAAWMMKSEVIPQARGQVFTEIPFVFVGTESLSPDCQESALLEIVTTNLHHYEQSADHKHGLRLSALPTPYTINEENQEGQGPIEFGPGTLQQLRGNSMSLGFWEWSGAGIESVRQELQDLKQDMASLGAAAITPPIRMAESAEALDAKHSEQSAPLVTVVDTLGQGLTEALQWLVYWDGGDEAATQVALNKQFANSKLSPQDIQALSAALQSGALTPEVFAYLLETAETLPPDINYKTYAEQLRAEKEARRAMMPQMNAKTTEEDPEDDKEEDPANPSPA